LLVVELAMHDRQGNWKDPDLEACAPWELWLVRARGGQVESRQALLTACNDGYGASGIGEDQLEVGPNRLHHTRVGGSAWRWSYSTTLQLDPLRVLDSAENGWWSLGVNEDSRSFSYASFSGKTSWYSPPCGPDGNPPDGDDPAVKANVKPYESLPIPGVTVEPTFLAGGWRETALGACSVTVDSAGQQGWVVHGRPGEAQDARLKVLLVGDRTLVLEIEDDRLVSGSPRWLFDDHVELWLGAVAGFGAHCLEAKESPPRQYALLLADGKVIPAHGKPTDALVVERAASPPEARPGWTRLKVTLPAPPEGITVVYSDGDDGQKQERLIATSRFAFGRGPTLGAVRTIKPEHMVCGAVNGVLQVRETRTFSPDKPVLGFGEE
jgi:hypothetical protein